MAGHTLVVLRHAKSDWSGDEDDIERPLAARGRRQAPEAGRWLDGHLPGVDLALISPAVRARETWELAAAELDDPPPARIDERVYGAGSSGLLAVVQDAPEDADTVVLVGHNPGVEELIARITGEWVTMPTSAMAVLAVPGTWASVGHGAETLTASGRPPASWPAGPE